VAPNATLRQRKASHKKEGYRSGHPTRGSSPLRSNGYKTPNVSNTNQNHFSERAVYICFVTSAKCLKASFTETSLYTEIVYFFFFGVDWGCLRTDLHSSNTGEEMGVQWNSTMGGSSRRAQLRKYVSKIIQTLVIQHFMLFVSPCVYQITGSLVYDTQLPNNFGV
jgi:hypothetical protein